MDRPGIDVFGLAAGVHRWLRRDTDVVAAVGGSEAQARAQIRLALDLSGDRATQAAARIWVLPAAEQAQAGGDVEEDGPGQPLTLRITVLHIAATYNTRGGGDAAAGIDRLRDRTRTALAGWVPPCFKGASPRSRVTHVIVAPDDLDRIPDPDDPGDPVAVLMDVRPVAPYVAPLRYAGGRLTAIGELIQGGRAWWADDYTIPVWLPHD